MTKRTKGQVSARPTDCAGNTTAFSSGLGIPIRINGAGPYLVSVDTGAGLTVVVPEISQELGLEKTGTIQRHGVGGSVTFDLVRVETVEAGGMTLDLNTLGVGTFLKRLCGQSFQGNLGYDILRHGRLTADFAGGRMTFGPGAEALGDGVAFETASANKPLVVVETHVNATGPHRFVIDTGAMGTCISPALAADLGVTRGSAVQAAGVGGLVEAYLAAEPVRVRIGGRYEGHVRPVVIDIFDSLSPGEDLHLSGIIGQDILRDYVVTFDYPERIVQFAAHATG